MAAIIIPDDLAPFATIPEAKAQAMINDALAMAARVAPCINDADFPYRDAAKAILRQAILRWNDSGTGALTQRQQTSGPFSVGESYDTRQTRRAMFWPSEISELASLCADATSGKAFEIDITPPSAASGGYWEHPDLWVPLDPTPQQT